MSFLSLILRRSDAATMSSISLSNEFDVIVSKTTKSILFHTNIPSRIVHSECRGYQRWWREIITPILKMEGRVGVLSLRSHEIDDDT